MTEEHADDIARLALRLVETAEDLEFIRPLSVEFHEESHFGDIPYSHVKRDRLLGKVLSDSDRYGIMFAEYGGDPVGFLFCVTNEYIVGTDALITTVLSFFVSKRHRGRITGARAAVRLLKAAVRWSEMRGAREILVHVTSGIDIRRTDRFLRKAGFTVLGANYSLPLEQGANGALPPEQGAAGS